MDAAIHALQRQGYAGAPHEAGHAGEEAGVDGSEHEEELARAVDAANYAEAGAVEEDRRAWRSRIDGISTASIAQIAVAQSDDGSVHRVQHDVVR